MWIRRKKFRAIMESGDSLERLASILCDRLSEKTKELAIVRCQQKVTREYVEKAIRCQFDSLDIRDFLRHAPELDYRNA